MSPTTAAATEIPRSRRSSTHRSIRSIQPHRQPTWRSSSLTKPLASVSIVFAEPEQGAPLASASSSVAGASSPMRSVGMKEVQEDEPLRFEQPMVVPEENGTHNSTNVGATAATTSMNARPFPSSPTRAPSGNPDNLTWPSSLTRSKGKTAMPSLTSESSPSSSTSNPNPTEAEPVSVPLPDSIPSSPPVETPPPALHIVPRTSEVPQEGVDPPPPQPNIVVPTSVRLSPPRSAPVTPQRHSPAKRSWFSSPPTPPPSPPRPIPATPPPEYPSVNLSESPTDVLPAPMQDPLVQNPVTPTSPAQQQHSTSAAPSRNGRPPSLPSSIDDRVPSLPPTPPATQTSHPSSTSPPLGHTVALNPSSSRFTLSIPLLGRAKMPLGSVLGMGEGSSNQGLNSKTSQSSMNVSVTTTDDSVPADSSTLHNNTASSSSASTLTPSSSSTVVPHNSSTITISTSNTSPAPSTPLSSTSSTSSSTSQALPSPAAADPATTSSTSTMTAISASQPSSDEVGGSSQHSSAPRQLGHPQLGLTSSSWWDYVGWSSGSARPPAEDLAAATSSAVDATASADGNSTGVDVDGVVGAAASAEDVKATALDLAQASENQEAEKANQQMLATVQEVLTTSEADRNAQVTVSTATSAQEGLIGATGAQTATWLSPWSWYYPTTTTTAAVDPQSSAEEKTDVEAPNFAEEGAPAKEDESPPTPAPEASLAVATVPQPQSPMEELAANPIASTIDSNRSGWASFFSSRALVVKTLGYGGGAGAGITGGGGEGDEVKRDEDGMEVMDLDLDEEGEAEVELRKELVERGRVVERKDVGRVAGVSTDPSTITKVLAAVASSTKPAITAAPAPTKIGPSNSGSSALSATRPSTSGSGQSSIKESNSVESTTSSTGKTSKKAPPLMISADVKRGGSPPSNISRKANSGSNTPRPGNSGMNTPADPQATFTPGSSVDAPTPSNTTTTTTTKIATTVIEKSGSKPSRTSSPAPSTKKAISGPPPPPNLVLPTWDDTFHTAPRNVVPERKLKTHVDGSEDGGGVGGEWLGKTMKFVSGVLFAKDVPSVGGSGGGGTARSKGKQRAREGSLAREGSGTLGGEAGETISILERERRERFREFGKELPKAWKIFDDAGSDVGVGVGGASTTKSGGGSGVSLAGAAAADLKGKAKALKKLTIGAENQSAGAGAGVGDGPGAISDVLRGCRRVVVIGVHGWFPGTMIRTVLGEPTGTSTKFANMTEQALLEFETEHGVKLDKITKIPLEGDGTIERRVERLYANLKANMEWMADLHDADAILVSTHSQGSVVSTHLLDRLIKDGHIVTARNQGLPIPSGTMPMGTGAEAFPSAIGLGNVDMGGGGGSTRKVQRVCCLAMCGIHLGPLRYLSSSTLVGPYLQYFESTAARELFEFQNTESTVSKEYAKALQNVLDHGTKVLYIASLNDQVVPIYSGLFTAVSHPLILRALYIDGDAYHSSDFLSSLLVLLLRILNSGMSDSGLLAHLSEATAGSLNGVGHSTAYEDVATYSLSVKYLFMANDGMTENTKLSVEPFNAAHEQNDYEIPWSLRDIIADERVTHFFGRDISELRDAFREWHPKTSILRDLKRKLQPIQRLPSTFSSLSGVGSVSTSKL